MCKRFMTQLLMLFVLLATPAAISASRGLAPSVSCPTNSHSNRALLAGDSYAQFMWDDRSHNDIFDKFGHADKRLISESLSTDPGPGYTGSEYSISGSEARQWVDTANYPWLANTVAALHANPEIDLVVLSIGGNDVFAGRPDGGWYKDMDLDVPGSEAALFDRIEADSWTIINTILAVRPDMRVLLSSYDYPNLNTGFWCFLYACQKRRDLSRDPDNDLITDSEINLMMADVEQRRIAWTNSDPRLFFDNSIGLMHYFYGDGESGPGVLPYPGQEPPDYLPFPGGNVLRPTLRSNFRAAYDPLHLDYDGYQYKITNQTMSTLFPHFRETPNATFFSQGGANDGWTNGTNLGTDRIATGDNGTNAYYGLVSFDTAAIPDGATISAASLYLIRQGQSGGNPFTNGYLGEPQVDVARGSFGGPAVELSDATANPTASDAGCLHGTVGDDYYALRVDLKNDGLAAVNDDGLTQFRLSFPNPDTWTDEVYFFDGDATLRSAAEMITTHIVTRTEMLPNGHTVTLTESVEAITHQGLAELMGTAAPFLDVTYCLAPPGTVDDMALLPAGEDAILVWSQSPNAEQYEVWHETNGFYGLPGPDCSTDSRCTPLAGPPYTAAGVLGDQNQHSFVLVARNGCGATEAMHQSGVLKYAIQPGSP